MNTVNVEWRPIPEFEGYYEASSDGQIRSCQRRACHINRVYPSRIVKQRTNRTNYLILNLHKAGVRTTAQAHQLIAAAFFGPAPKQLQVRHLDGNSQNNCIDNLAYGTAKDNAFDRRLHGTHLEGEGLPQSKLNVDTVNRMRREHQIGLRVSDLARKYGVAYSTAYHATHGNTWAHVEMAVSQ